MTLNGRCPHLKDRRTKRSQCKPAITLCVAGTQEGFTLCPECYDIIIKGGIIETTLTSRRNRRYKIFRAKESYERPFFELRTEWMATE